MLGWIIFGSIILLIVLLLMQSVKATFCYENGKVDLKVKFLFLTLFPLKPRKPKKSKRKKQIKSAAKNVQNEQTEANEPLKEETPKKADSKGENKSNSGKSGTEKPKKSGLKFDFDLEMIMDYVRTAAPPVKRLFKKIRVRDLYIDYVVGTDDAAKTAIKYGTICAAVYPIIEWLTTYFSVQAREVKIEADFSRESDNVFAYCVVKLRLGTALFCAIWFLIKFAKTYLKYNNTQQKKPVKARKRKG